MATTTQGVKIDERTQLRLKELAKVKKRTPHYLMREAIESYLDREESFEQRKREDAERWERYLLTGDFVANEVVDEWLQKKARGEAAPWPL